MINQLQKTVNDVLNFYEVEVNAKHNIDTNALSLILVTELFKELQGINEETKKPAQNRKSTKKAVGE